MVGAGDRGASRGYGDSGKLENSRDSGSAGHADSGVRSGRVGDGNALFEARSAAGGGTVPRAARGESGAVQIVATGTVEASRDTFRARGRNRGAYREDVCGPRFESRGAD